MNRSSSTTLLIVLMVIFTFPIWIGLAGGIFGLFFGLLGGLFGLIGGILGAIFGAIGGIFKAIFHGIFGWGWHGGFPHLHFNKYVLLAVIIIAALAIQKHQQKK